MLESVIINRPLPHTGAAKQNGLATLGAISTAFAAATLIAARKKELEC